MSDNFYFGIAAKSHRNFSILKLKMSCISRTKNKKNISSSIPKIRLLRIETNTLQCFCAEKKNERMENIKNKWKIFNFPLATRIPPTDDRQRSMRLNFSRKKNQITHLIFIFRSVEFCFFLFLPRHHHHTHMRNSNRTTTTTSARGCF